MKVYVVYGISSGYEYYHREIVKVFSSFESAEKYNKYKNGEKERFDLMDEDIAKIREEWSDEHPYKNYRLEHQAQQQYDKLSEKTQRGKANSSDIKKHKDLVEKARALADNSITDYQLLQEKIKQAIVSASFLYEEEKKVMLENNFGRSDGYDEYELEEMEVEE